MKYEIIKLKRTYGHRKINEFRLVNVELKYYVSIKAECTTFIRHAPSNSH